MIDIKIEETDKEKMQSTNAELFDMILKDQVHFTAIIVTSPKDKAKATTAFILNNSPMLKQMIHFNAVTKSLHELNTHMLDDITDGLKEALKNE